MTRTAGLNDNTPRPRSVDAASAKGWAAVLAGTAMTLAGSFAMMPDASGKPAAPLLFLALFALGMCLNAAGARLMRQRSQTLPEQEFHRPLVLRRLVIVAANLLVLAGNLPWFLAPIPWSVAGLVLAYLSGAALLAVFLQPYQIWVFGQASGLDEYHMLRRLRARDFAYTGLALATFAALLACGLARWAPPGPVILPIAFFYMWLLISLPCMVLAWTEPDPD